MQKLLASWSCGVELSTPTASNLMANTFSEHSKTPDKSPKCMNCGGSDHPPTTASALTLHKLGWGGMPKNGLLHQGPILPNSNRAISLPFFARPSACCRCTSQWQYNYTSSSNIAQPKHPGTPSVEQVRQFMMMSNTVINPRTSTRGC